MTAAPSTDLASTIDHTALKASVRRADIEKLCAEASQFKFWSVCVNPQWVSTAHELLRESSVRVCTVVGFPLGATLAAAIAAETRVAVDAGADEIDMVIPVGRLQDGDDAFVEEYIAGVVRAAGPRLVKVILETCLLSDDQIRKGCELAVRAGARFVKTSTGFSSSGATVHAVQLMKASVPTEIGIKASGGIRTAAAAHAMLAAGATRLGTSASVNIVSDNSASSSSRGANATPSKPLEDGGTY